MLQVPLIHIVDDDESFGNALAKLLKLNGFEVKYYRNSGHFLLANVEKRPGCVLLDYHLPGPNGLELQKALAKRNINLPVIFLTGFATVRTAVEALKHGAVEFLEKPVSQEGLLTAIGNALSIQAELFIQINKLSCWRASYQSLTPREQQVFYEVVSGKLNKVIAEHLGASERTIKAHRASIMGKMQAQSLAQLVQIAVHLGLLDNTTFGASSALSLA